MISPTPSHTGNGYTGTAPRSVLLVDAHPVIRLGLRQVLAGATDLSVCGEAACPAEALQLVRRHRPDAVILDIDFGAETGLLLVKQIRVASPGCAVLVFSAAEPRLFAARALQAGARGFVETTAGSDTVLTNLRRVLAGRTAVDPRLCPKPCRRVRGAREEAEAVALAVLSDRELDVFRLIARGYGTKDIALDLNRTVKTIETHRAHIVAKLGCGNGAALVRFAWSWSHRYGPSAIAPAVHPTSRSRRAATRPACGGSYRSRHYLPSR